MDYGILTLLPPFAMLVFAIKTKKSFETLVFGSLVAFIITDGIHFLGPWCEMLLEECSNPDNQYILLLCGLFGSLIFLLKDAKGTMGFSRFMSKICKTEPMILVTSVVMGIIIFVDDYLNIMTVGTCMNEVCDKHRIPRESLAYIVDSTSAPMCALVPFSTWAVFYAGIFYTEQSVIDLGYGSGLSTYIHAIPLMFYPIAALVLCFLFALGVVPKIGPMKAAYERVQATESVPVEGHEHQPTEDGELIDFLLPIGILIGGTIVTGDMLIAIVLTLFVCLFFYLIRKKMNFDQFFALFMAGFSDMIPVLAILLSSFMVRNACGRMNLSEYVISCVEPILTPEILPCVIFLLIAGLTFVTSSFWGIEAISIPIVVPLCVTLGGDLLLVLAAVVSGGVFGSHACFYSDATVLSSVTCEVDNLDHAMTQVPYAVLGAILASAAYLVCGFLF